MPTPRSRPHDPAVAPRLSLLRGAEGVNKLRRLDRKIGEFKEYRLKCTVLGRTGWRAFRNDFYEAKGPLTNSAWTWGWPVMAGALTNQ